MLTDEDLQKIAQLVDERVKLQLNPLSDQIKTLHTKLTNQIKKLDKKLSKKLDTTISYFDGVTTNHEKRIKRVETKLDLPIVVD